LQDEERASKRQTEKDGAGLIFHGSVGGCTVTLKR
jgi:hypothetical protein